MTGTMRAIVKEKPEVGATYRTDVPIPQISDEEVLVKVKATADSHRRSQKARPYSPHRFSTRSGNPLSTRAVTSPFNRFMMCLTILFLPFHPLDGSPDPQRVSRHAHQLQAAAKHPDHHTLAIDIDFLPAV